MAQTLGFPGTAPSRRKASIGGLQSNWFNICFNCDSEHAFGEIALYRAIIMQALLDLGSKSKLYDVQSEKAKVESWIFGNNRAFYDVCDFADIHPEQVKKIAKKIMQYGLIWQTEKGKSKRYLERQKYRERQKEQCNQLE